jgi:DNA-binding transcriptional regulator GbsR (MarR family)
MSKNYTVEEVIEAIKKSGSIVSSVAKTLKCDWNTAKKYIDKWEETRKAFDSAEQTILDMCESTLYQSVQDGDTHSAKWILSTKGKTRGWGEKLEIDGNFKVEIVDDIKD